MIGDRAYDSDSLDTELAAWGIELIAPHRTNRRAPHAGWAAAAAVPLAVRMERLHAWLRNYRRVLVRWEYHLENFRASM